MRYLKMLLLLFVVNIAFDIVLTVILAIFHVSLSLIPFAFVYGFGIAFFTLFISKWLAKRMYRMTQITIADTGIKKNIYLMVQEISNKVGLHMPEVWLYNDKSPNAFATGPSKNNSMVAVSVGLVNLLDQQEIKSVIAHEIGHIYNGDMLSTTILSGVMNGFVILGGNIIGRTLGKNFISKILFTILFEYVLSLFAMIPLLWFSRHREYAADKFAAQMEGKDGIINSLNKIYSYKSIDRRVSKDVLATAYIKGNWKGFFSTHPSLKQRVLAINTLNIQYPYKKKSNFCTNCGIKLSQDGLYCNNCRTKIK